MAHKAIKEYMAFAEHLADASGAIARKYFRQVMPVEIKQDASPVTEADRNIELALRTLIQDHFPQHGIMGEEFAPHNMGAAFQWTIDPIDGTKSFIAGRPIFATLISLLYEGKPIVGVLDQPITRERWVAGKGQGAFMNGAAIHTKRCASLDHAVLATTGPQYFLPEQWESYSQLAKQVRFPLYGGDAYNYGLLAAGWIDVVVETGLKTHDFCALAVLIEEAGGKITDWQGDPLAMTSDGTIIAVGDSSCYDQVKHILSQKRKKK